MTQPPVPDPLEPELRQAEEELKRQLEEACDVGDVRAESTGELERLEDALTDAAKAAKQAVTLRRKLGARRKAERADQVAVRQFADRAGRRWRVWEVQPGAVRTRRTELSGGEPLASWLAFQSLEGAERRRLAPYPSDWLTLSEAELVLLVDSAQPVPEFRSRPTRRAEDEPAP
jgi:hypothetical protein